MKVMMNVNFKTVVCAFTLLAASAGSAATTFTREKAGAIWQDEIGRAHV